MNNSAPDTALAAALLRYLKREWTLPSLAYQSPPTPITGGFETSIYRFQLQGAPQGVSDTLILRLFKQYASPGKALQESSVQNTVAASGFPAPRVFVTCTDTSVLGGEFNIMEYMSGTPMFETPVGRLPETLGIMHARLHEIDPRPIIQALQAHGFNERRFTLQGQFNWIQRQIDSEGYDWLEPGLTWLERHKPTIKQVALCHGDFHPLNILMKEGVVSGVLDWSGFRITDPTHDIAATKVIMSIVAPVLVPVLVQSLLPDYSGPRPILTPDYVERYLAAYHKKRPLIQDRLMYFEVHRLILGLVDGAGGQQVWRHPDILTQIQHTIREYTGLHLDIPQRHNQS